MTFFINIFFTVTSEEFLSEVPSALHLRRLSILCNVDEIREMVTHLGLSYVVWSDLYQLDSEPELLKFKALCLCHKKSALTFRKVKNAIKELPFQVPHILCEVNGFYFALSVHVLSDTRNNVIFWSVMSIVYETILKNAFNMRIEQGRRLEKFVFSSN